MIIILYGKDTFRSKEKLKEIVEEYKRRHESGLNLKFFSPEDHPEELEDCEKQVSMFDEKRLVVIKEAFSSDGMKNVVLKQKRRMVDSEDIFIIHQEGEVKKGDELLKSFSEEAGGVMIQEFTPLSSKELLSWIEREFRNKEVEVSREAVKEISSLGNENTWRIKNEIEKLSLYKKKVGKEDVDLMVDTEAETNIFKTIDAVAEKNKEKALLCAYNHLKKGDNPLYLFSMLGYQFRNLMIVKDLSEKGFSYNDMKEKSGLHPFVFKKSCEQAGKFSLAELEEIYHNLFEMDLKTKTGQIDPVLALHLFIFDC